MTPACGWGQAVFRGGRCGIEHTATTEDDHLKAVGAHRDAHAVWDRLNPSERRRRQPVSTPAIFFATYASLAGALITPFAIAAGPRTIARIHAQANQKEQ
ncbi:hypothetical protein ABZ719_31150 [Streptomyces sp. NPDC006743]|uniref:hypothetical protein n=1 Tax=Streptomyces sp. NPDC006743 TaxID=3154480 RepID=UPI003455DBB8